MQQHPQLSTVTNTDRARARWNADARGYDRRMALFERIFYGDGREWVCSRAWGKVLEVAVGSGRNFALYSPGVRVTGVDLSQSMIELARARALALGKSVELKVADAEALPFDDERFDSVVCTLSLCSIPDDRKAAQEMWRVLRTGGSLLLLDHVRAHTRLGLMIQHALERNRQGEYYTRRPLDYLADVGFEINEVRSMRRGWVECVAACKPGPTDPTNALTRCSTAATSA